MTSYPVYRNDFLQKISGVKLLRCQFAVQCGIIVNRQGIMLFNLIMRSWPNWHRARGSRAIDHRAGEVQFACSRTNPGVHQLGETKSNLLFRLSAIRLDNK